MSLSLPNVLGSLRLYVDDHMKCYGKLTQRQILCII